MIYVILSIDDLVAAPIGVALLDRIEHEQSDEFSPFAAIQNTDPKAVQRGVERVGTMSFGQLLEVVLDAANHIAGPWSPGAATSLAFAYEAAVARLPIAEAICERFGKQFGDPIDLNRQQCWLSDVPGEDYWAKPAFSDFSQVYANGEFTWDGFWTVTDPPPEIHDALIGAWEMHPGPITRWRLPVTPDVRLWTIDRPSDWVGLVETYPVEAQRPHYGWELPGPNQHLEEMSRLVSIESQHALRAVISRHVLPDWTSVASDFDGVHLSWGGFLTTEGYLSDLTKGGVSMLRYWSSERTLWLRDVFGQPEPLVAPELSGSMSGAIGLDASWGDDVRTNQDLRLISTRLGR